MRYSGYRPNPYRGRRSKQPLFAALAAGVLVLGICWYFLSDYMIFSADGFEFGSQLERPEDPAPPADYGEPDFVIVEPDPDPVIPDTPADPGGPEQALLYKLYPADVTRAPEEGYLAGCIAAAKAGGYEAIALTVRTEEGLLYLPCGSRYAQDAAVSNAEAIAAAVKAAAADFPFAAVMPVCRDGKAPRLFRDQALRTSGVTWLDYNYVSWFNPYQAGAGDYAAALLGSCRDAGFSAVVLTRLSFPSRGKVELIESYEGQTDSKQQVITALAGKLADQAGQLGLQLSLLLESDQAENILVTGQSVKDLQSLVSCIYLPQGDPTPMIERYTECRFGLYTADSGYLIQESAAPAP